MIRIHPTETMGHSEMDWLSARHHFSFADYVNPQRLQFGALRVWNDDRFRAHGGFPMHPHRDMEIITYVHSGAITHRDSLGNHGVTTAGNVQVMSAGRGIVHSEFNRHDEDLGLFQIWILPDRAGHDPGWEAGVFDRAARRNVWQALVSGRGHPGALPIHQDAAFFVTDVTAGASLDHRLDGRRGYLVPVHGRVRINGMAMAPRAAAEIEGEDALTLAADETAEVVLLDLS